MSKKTLVFVIILTLCLTSLLSLICGLAGGILGQQYLWPYFERKGWVKAETVPTEHTLTVENEDSAVIDAVDIAGPAVVSIVISQDVPVYEQYFSDPYNFFPEYRQNGTEKQEIGGGSGFIISTDGYIITNNHVVAQKDAEYTVFLANGDNYTATVLARDPSNDYAFLKIEATNLPVLELGDSDALKVGQTAIAIGYALGEFKNSVSKGVVSGLEREITAGDLNTSEQLENVIQTDAAINPGNSGGPLINISGQVIGVNVAVASGSENIGFAIPINQIKSDIETVKNTGKLSRPFLGLRTAPINAKVQKANDLSVDYGALVQRGDQPEDLAVVPGSPADKAGIVENDIILEINGVKIDAENTLLKLVQTYKVGDKINVKILHQGTEKTVEVILAERPS